MSLVEIVVTIAILAVVGIGFVYVFTSGFALMGKATKIENDQYTARQYAESITAADGSTKVSETETTIKVGGTQVAVRKITVSAGDKSSTEYSYYE